MDMRLSLWLQIIIILEIMIRKCGSSAVKVVTPEKYREFVKSVLEVAILLYSIFLFWGNKTPALY